MLTLSSLLRLTPELIAECERVVSKTFPACVAFHKPSFVQQLKSASLDAALVYGLLTCAARYVFVASFICHTELALPPHVSSSFPSAGAACVLCAHFLRFCHLTPPPGLWGPHRSVPPSPTAESSWCSRRRSRARSRFPGLSRTFLNSLFPIPAPVAVIPERSHVTSFGQDR